MAIRYPNKITKSVQNINYAHRGLLLENMINQSNNYYLEKDIALIFKKPTPIRVVKVNFENNYKKINKAYFEAPSTLDYNGLYKGHYLEFEAKETKNKTSFPLKNIHPHQKEHIKKVILHGGICFLIIMIKNETYLLSGNDYLAFLENNLSKSIKYDYIKSKGFLIETNIKVQCDYLKVIDKIYFKEN